MSIERSMDRRGFVKLVGAGLMAAGGARLAVGAEDAAAPTAKSAAKFKKAIGYEMVGENLSVLDKFKMLKELGFDGVEVASGGRPDREEFLKARDATGLEIHSVMNPDHWRKPLSHPDPKVREECRKSMQGSLEDAKYWGAGSVLLVPAVVNKEIAYDEAYTRSQAEIRKLAPIAEKLGVVIGVEFVWNNFLLSPLEFANRQPARGRILRHRQRPRIRLSRTVDYHSRRSAARPHPPCTLQRHTSDTGRRALCYTAAGRRC